MGADRPKQYLALGDRSVIEWTLLRMSQVAGLSAIVVGLSEDDQYWSSQSLPADVRVDITAGGAERSHTVLNALRELAVRGAVADDLVLVHDAVRPCVRVSDVDNLVAVCGDSEHGGILGSPLVDTLKRVGSDGEIRCSERREGLWRAMTPQLFRLGPLQGALGAAQEAGHLVTDEAEAMEMAGYTPRILDSDSRNIKITRTADLALARSWIEP